MAGPIDNFWHSGWLHAVFVGCVAYPLGMIASRLGVVNFDAHPIAYTALIMLATGLSLMLGARPGPLGYDTLRSPSTWLYGFLNTLVFIFAVAMAGYVSATEVSLLGASTLWVYALSFLFLGQAINRHEWLGLGLLAIPMVVLFTHLNLTDVERIELGALIILQGFTQALQKITAERHRTNRAADSFQQNMRVTAIVMAVTGCLFMFIFLGLAYLKSQINTPLWPSLPQLSDFLNWPMYVTAAFIGLLIRAPSKYCEFYATKKISARYFLAVIALQPIFTFIFESALNALGILALTPLPPLVFAVMGGIILGSLILAFAGYRKGGTPSTILDDVWLDAAVYKTVQHTVATTLAFCRHNKIKAARLLGLDAHILKKLLTEATPSQAYPADFVRQLQENFASKVAMADPLTGLANRLQFNTTLNQLLKKRPLRCTIALIDLNHFKPINDTYGHAAGDLVLGKTADRLKKWAGSRAKVARLGGDEFAVLTPQIISVADLARLIARPIPSKFGVLHVTAAIGLATAPQDGTTAAALLGQADQAMYAAKNKSR